MSRPTPALLDDTHQGGRSTFETTHGSVVLAAGDEQNAGGAHRGRFRSYLLAALKNHIVNERKHAAVRKRGGGQVPIPLEDLVREHRATRSRHRIAALRH
jgi:hypothetical protein